MFGLKESSVLYRLSEQHNNATIRGQSTRKDITIASTNVLKSLREIPH